MSVETSAKTIKKKAANAIKKVNDKKQTVKRKAVATANKVKTDVKQSVKTVGLLARFSGWLANIIYTPRGIYQSSQEMYDKAIDQTAQKLDQPPKKVRGWVRVASLVAAGALTYKLTAAIVNKTRKK